MATAWLSVEDYILPQTHLREEIDHVFLAAVGPHLFSKWDELARSHYEDNWIFS